MSKTKRRWGDRKDGRWVRDLDSLHRLMPHVYVGRTNSEVYISEEFDITELLAYIKEQNELHPEFKTTLFHAILTAMGKVIYSRPLLNRFIAGRRTYERNDIVFSFMAKRQFNDTSAESLMLLKIKPEATLNDISNRIVGNVKDVRAGKDAGADAIMDFLTKMPRPVLIIVSTILRILDYYGKLPTSISSVDVNYSTAIVTNLGSIKCSSVYHHLSNWGTCSIIIAIGTIHKKPFYNEDGSVTLRDVVDIGMTIDERIGDGFYFAKSLKFLQHILSNPQLLDLPIEEEVEYEY